MAQTHYDVIVAGLGAAGSAACWQLAARGAQVLGLERFSAPNSMGSHHGSSRVIRTAYYEHPDYVPLLRRSFALWRALERESGAPLLTMTGGLYMGGPESQLLAGSLQAAREHGLPHDYLPPEALAARFPQFSLPDGVAGMHEPEAGALDPEASIRALLGRARRGGIELRQNEPVASWEADAAGVAVRTSEATYRARRLILACGAWSGELLPGAAADCAPTRQCVGYALPRDTEMFSPQRLPVWMIELPEGLYYGLPQLNAQGIKLACHDAGTPADPLTLERTATDADKLPLNAFIARCLPAAGAAVRAVEICLYENSPDGHFILDRHPEHDNVLYFAGGSGHAFKFAPVIGQALCEMALDGGTQLPVGFLSAQRFNRL